MHPNRIGTLKATDLRKAEGWQRLNSQWIMSICHENWKNDYHAVATVPRNFDKRSVPLTSRLLQLRKEAQKNCSFVGYGMISWPLRAFDVLG